MRHVWLTFVLLCFVTYRVTRFIVLDSLIEVWREKFYNALLAPLSESDRRLVLDLHEDAPLRILPWWRRKFYQLFSCPFCISVWIAGAVVSITNQWYEALPLPVWWWLAVSTGSLIVYRIIDAED